MIRKDLVSGSKLIQCSYRPFSPSSPSVMSTSPSRTLMRTPLCFVLLCFVVVLLLLMINWWIA